MTPVAGRVGDYEVLDPVGERGGMAVVFRARQSRLGRDVALKQVDLRGGAEMVERFVREARLAGSLNHPNIVTVHDFFEHDGVPYIAMEFLECGSLRRCIGRLSRAQSGGVLEGVLAGLAHAHGEGIVHRDIKPENILVTASGGVKLGDFGIARAFAKITGRLTRTGMTVGTPAYMAPEQALDGELGPWTDLYATGVVAYEMLLGRLPFADTETPVAVLLRHVQDPVPPPLDIDPSLDPGIASWLERMLAKDPGARPAGAAAAWDEFEDALVPVLGALWRRVAPLRFPETAESPEPEQPVSDRAAEPTARRLPTPDGHAAVAPTGDGTGYRTFDPPPPPRPPTREPPLPAGDAQATARAGPAQPDDAAGGTRRDATFARPERAGPPLEAGQASPVAPEAATSAAAADLSATLAPRRPPAPPQPVRDSPRRSARRRRRLLALLAASGVVVGLLVVMLIVRDRQVKIAVGFGPSDVAVGAGAIWVTNSAGGVLRTERDDDTVSRIDPASNRTVGAPIVVGGEPTGVAIGAGAVWVANRGSWTVIRIDPATNRLVGQTLELDHKIEKVAVGAGAAWVTVSEEPELVRIDVQSVLRLRGQTGQTIDSDTIHVGERPSDVAVGADAVWVTNFGDDTVSRIDPQTREVTATTRVGRTPTGVAVGAGSVWVANRDDDTVSRIDPRRAKVAATIRVGDSPSDVAVGEGSVWVTNWGDDTLSRIDPATNRAAEQPIGVGDQPVAVAVGEGAIWVVNEADDAVSRIDPKSAS
jgi:YVTN family beta-propeller protein